MRKLGTIVRLQVQRSGLKVAAPAGAAHPRLYEPVALLEVPALLLTPDGVVGLVEWASGEERVVDVHHRAHRETKNADVNGVSVGFTAHYVAMRGRFGEHLGDGVAGENVLVETVGQIDPEAVRGGLALGTRDGTLACLERVVVAEPCAEFTRFALQLGTGDRSGDSVTEGLRFLREGMRGFYATFTGAAGVAGAVGSIGGAASAGVNADSKGAAGSTGAGADVAGATADAAGAGADEAGARADVPDASADVAGAGADEPGAMAADDTAAEIVLRVGDIVFALD